VRLGLVLILGVENIIFFPALLPHVALRFHKRAYHPGLATAVVAILPSLVVFFRRMFAAEILTLRTFLMIPGLAPVAMMVLMGGFVNFGELAA
jgi:hypothetical protein